MIAIYLFWIGFAVFNGTSEALLYHIRDYNKKLPFNEHIVFTIMRFCVLLIAIHPLDYSVWFAASAILCFPFFHDGAYYTTRNLLSPGTYKNSWLDSSETTSAILSFGINARLLFLAASLVCLFFAY